MTRLLAPIKVTLAQVRLYFEFLHESDEFQTRNYQLNDGSFAPFVIVPFQDGSMPNQGPVSFLSSWS